MIDPAKALTSALDNSSKVGGTPLFATVIDKLVGFKISEWAAQGDAIKKHILDGYEDAKQKGLGVQYVSAFRENANLINVGTKAARYIDVESQKVVDIDNDVFWGLIDHSKKISNDEMQELIARIIAGEYNAPGTYSMSTLQVLKTLGKAELELFEKMGSLLLDQTIIPKRIFNIDDDVKPFVDPLNIDFGSLQVLQSLGLFLPNEMTNSIRNPENKNYETKYFDKSLIYKSVNGSFENVNLPDHFGISPVGAQILKHLNPKYIETYYRWLKEHYKIAGYELVP